MTMNPSPGTSGSHIAGMINASLEHQHDRALHAEQVAELDATSTTRPGRLGRLLARLRRH